MQKIYNSKNTYYGLLMITIALIISLSGCKDTCEITTTYVYYSPVYTSMEEIRASVATEPSKEMTQLGKIYFRGKYLFINEPNSGVHVINNEDPSNPINEAFIKIPGSFDIAVDGNILYSDSYIDMVAIDISDINNVREVGRVKNIFPSYNSYGFYADEQQGIVTGWKEEGDPSTFESGCEGSEYAWGWQYNHGIALEAFDATAAVAPTNPGMAGSMSRFALSNGFLYAIDQNDLYPINITNPADLKSEDKVTIEWGVETLFPKGDKLFIGAQNGMYIMSLENPAMPQWVSTYTHIRSCDPVVVDGDYAYVTLRSGTACQGFTNQLEIIDISDIRHPQLLETYEMFNPHGLGKDGDVLFICDGDDGLKAYNVNDISAMDQNMLMHNKNIHAYDIIPYNNVAMMIGADGLYQYDYSDMSAIKLLSHLKILPANGN